MQKLLLSPLEKEQQSLEHVESLMHRLIRGSSESVHASGKPVTSKSSLDQGDVLSHIALQHLKAGGKRLRARLALACAEDLGLNDGSIYHWAAACELAHNATLLHDDLQDGDTLRRGQPTAWVLHGAAQAINAGDLLLMLPFQAITSAGLSAALSWRLSKALHEGLIRVIRGQGQECALLQEEKVDWPVYWQTIEGKTAALFALPVVGSSLLAGYDDASIERLQKPFRGLGALFQLQDDIVDLYGNKGREQIGCDLYEGKISALVVAHIELYPKERPALWELLKTPRAQTSAKQVLQTIERFRQGGALALVLQRFHEQATQLLQEKQHQALVQQLYEWIKAPIAHLFCEEKNLS